MKFLDILQRDSKPQPGRTPFPSRFWQEIAGANLGMKNTVELLTEKSNLLNAQQETLQAKYMAILNMQLLKFYQGEKIEL